MRRQGLRTAYPVSRKLLLLIFLATADRVARLKTAVTCQHHALEPAGERIERLEQALRDIIEAGGHSLRGRSRAPR